MQKANPDLDPSSEQFKKAYDTRCKGWESYFEELIDAPIFHKWDSGKEIGKFTLSDFDKELHFTILENANHPVVDLCLYLYTCDEWLFKEINTGSREGDQSKVDTLGPYAQAFGMILSKAAMHRNDIDAMKKLLAETGTKLYRGTGLSEK